MTLCVICGIWVLVAAFMEELRLEMGDKRV